MPARKIIRCIGIDFGTSTSVVCYKDYPDGRGDASEPKELRIRNNPLIPTLIYCGESGTTLFGEDAVRKGMPELVGPKPKGHLAANFKMDLVSRDPARVEKAQEYMTEFLRFLHAHYKAEPTLESGAQLEEHTYVSYPAKWPAEVAEMTKQAARQAGFPNVKGMDEPSAAMQYFLLRETKEMRDLAARQVIVAGKPLVVLLIDMGAGTTDLVLYHFVPGSQEGHKVLATWPSVQEAEMFGGREVDARLAAYLRTLIASDPVWLARLGRCGGCGLPRDEANPECPAHPVENAGLLQQCKEWKETEVSRELAAEEGAIEQPPRELRLSWQGGAVRLDRKDFGGIAADYLPDLVALVNGLIAHAQEVTRGRIKGGQDIDLVLLTGGHSQWYFVKEMLLGKWVPGLPGVREGGSGVRLEKVQKDPQRLLCTPTPQQTVALGLAMSGMPMTIKRVMTNNVWLKFKIGLTVTAAFQVFKMGEDIPARHQFQKTFKVKADISEDIPGSCTAYSGRTLERAICYTPAKFSLRVVWLLKQLDKALKRLSEWAGENHNKDENDIDLNLTVSVDSNQRVTVSGTIDHPLSWSETLFKVSLAGK
jgi:molecular chaperone DnaK (HSP70)